MSTPWTARLPRSAGNRGSQTVIGNPAERLGEFGNHLVIPSPGTEYYNFGRIDLLDIGVFFV